MVWGKLKNLHGSSTGVNPLTKSCAEYFCHFFHSCYYDPGASSNLLSFSLPVCKRQTIYLSRKHLMRSIVWQASFSGRKAVLPSANIPFQYAPAFSEPRPHPPHLTLKNKSSWASQYSHNKHQRQKTWPPPGWLSSMAEFLIALLPKWVHIFYRKTKQF